MRSRPFLILTVLLTAILNFAACDSPLAKQRDESMSCGNYMCSIGFGARLWAEDRDNTLPRDLLSLSNELATPKLLICPGDHSRISAANWASFTDATSSYEIVNPGLSKSDTNRVFLRCKVHHDHLGYADGTVFDGVARRTKVP